jgi:hypothetical protein
MLLRSPIPCQRAWTLVRSREREPKGLCARWGVRRLLKCRSLRCATGDNSFGEIPCLADRQTALNALAVRAPDFIPDDIRLREPCQPKRRDRKPREWRIQPIRGGSGQQTQNAAKERDEQTKRLKHRVLHAYHPRNGGLRNQAETKRGGPKAASLKLSRRERHLRSGDVLSLPALGSLDYIEGHVLTFL